MIMTPSSFTLEYLGGLKFKELQKLSAQFNVNKRWAKKQELIHNLLALREKNSVESEEEEWKDGSTVFKDTKQSNETEMDRRLTFNVSSKSNAENNNPHLTFDVPQNGKILLNEISFSRETYDIPPKNLDVEPLLESRATFDIPPKNRFIDDGIQNGKKKQEEIHLNEQCFKTDIDNSGLKKAKCDLVIKNRKEKFEKAEPQVKMLTIPCARVSRRTGQNDIKVDSPIKMSKRSINIKKSTRLPISKGNIIKSPAFSSMKKSVSNRTITQSLVKAEPNKTFRSKVPVRLQFKENENNKENVKGALETLSIKSSKVAHSRKTLPMRKLNLNSPDDKPTPKPITLTKMPDFSKIHKKQFDQMDSLHDYIRKKEERIKKLFGTPQPGQQLQALSKTAPVFHFQSSTLDQKSKGNKTSKNMATPLKKKENSKTAQKETFMSKLPPSKFRSDIKDKNRSHIHGVRTNKRFELQMKFRNM